MNILKTTTDAQTLKFIPRAYTEVVNVSITDRNTKEVTTFITSATTDSSGYEMFDYSFNLVEGRFYTYEIISTAVVGEVVHRGQIFCTDQTDYDKYEMAKDEYITSDDKDDTIILF